ncbi:MAG: hypothetical protein Q7T56_14760 [Nocardioidaceae bacterium]|nr:hypothetical protein [Nocardioidaceae bacterium]
MNVLSGSIDRYVYVSFYDAADVIIGSPVTVAVMKQNTETEYSFIPTLVPTGSVQARLALRPYRDFGETTAGDPTANGTIVFNRVTMTQGDSQLAVTGVDYSVRNKWVNVFSRTTDLAVDRKSLDLGTLTAVIRDETLDPATAPDVRTGKAIRAMAYTGTTWEPFFTGHITSSTTTYKGGAEITINAVDAMNKLSNARRPKGVAQIAHLPFVFEGTGVAWECNGYNGQVADAAVVTSSNESASGADQLAITRDSVLGFAWVNRRNVVVARDAAHEAAPSVPLTSPCTETWTLTSTLRKSSTRSP